MCSCESVTGARAGDVLVGQAWVLHPGRLRVRNVESPEGNGGAVFGRTNGCYEGKNKLFP